MAGRSDPDASAFNPDAVRCTAKSKRSGKRCRNPAMTGKRVCRFHGGMSLSGEDRTEKQKANHPPTAGKVNRGSFRKGNQAARKHGAYSSVLTPEEREDVARLRAAFTEEAGKHGPVTAFDSHIIDRAAIACVKSDAAALGNAPGRILMLWNRMLLTCLRELRVTRATRKTDTGVGSTNVEVMAVLLEQIRRCADAQTGSAVGDSDSE